jgi:hypothetical protein
LERARKAQPAGIDDSSSMPVLSMGMQPAFRLSVALNGLLGAALALSLMGIPSGPSTLTGVTGVENAGAARSSRAASSRKQAPSAEGSFRWSQLESTDYPTYIANLRSIGCPEATVRDIIAGEVESLYADRIGQLERALAGDQVHAPRRAEGELARLKTEEAGLVSLLLGMEPASVGDQGGNGLARSFIEDVPAADAFPLPMVFKEVNNTDLQLNEDQLAYLAVLRERFIQELGGSNADPDSPAYAANWSKSQPEIDDALRGAIGDEAFQNYQMALGNPAR